MSTARQYCSFRLEGELYGVPVEDVQEVLHVRGTTRVPRGDPSIAGLFALRGDIVTALDLARRLAPESAPRTAREPRTLHVVLAARHGSVSLVVDAAGEVLELGEDAFEPPPTTLPAAARALLRGVYKLDGELLLALDLERLCEPRTAPAR